MSISKGGILGHGFNEGQKSIFDIQEALALIGSAVPVLVQQPIVSDRLVELPAFRVRFAFEDAAVVFPQGIVDLVGQFQSLGEDFGGFYSPT